MVLGPEGPSNCTDCRQGYLARGAQQQAAQREEREREGSEKPCLLHGGDYSRTKRRNATRMSERRRANEPGGVPAGRLAAARG